MVDFHLHPFWPSHARSYYDSPRYLTARIKVTPNVYVGDEYISNYRSAHNDAIFELLHPEGRKKGRGI